MSCELKDMKNCRRWLAFKKSLSKHLQENLQKPLCEFQTRSLITSADFLKSKLGRVEEYTILFVVQLEKLECSDMRLKIAILKFGFFSSTLCLTVTRLLDSIPLNSSSLYSMPILIMSLLLLYEKLEKKEGRTWKMRNSDDVHNKAYIFYAKPSVGICVYETMTAWYLTRILTRQLVSNIIGHIS